MRDGNVGFRKVGHKSRRGRKQKNAGKGGHKGHRNTRAINDPLSKAQKKINLDRKRKDDERVERNAW